MTPDLTTTYLGLTLRSPFVAAASPLTGDLETLVALEAAGAAAVVLPSLFEEHIERDRPQVDEHLRLVTDATQTLTIPIIASLNGSTPGGWLEYAERLQIAGADAIELNAYSVETDPYASAASIEDQLLRLVHAVRRSVSIPVSVKLSPFYTSLAHVAARLEDAGAAGLVLFNRFVQPDIDLTSLTVRPELHLSSRDEMRLPLRWIAILRGRVPLGLAATSGVQEPEDGIKLVLAGADVVMVASELLRRGPTVLTELRDGLSEWLDQNRYPSVGPARGSLSQEACGDPKAFERAQYVRTLSDAHAGAALRAR